MDAIAFGFLGALVVRKEAFPILFRRGRLPVLIALMLPGFLAIAASSRLPTYFAALAPSYVALFFLALLLLVLQDTPGLAGQVLKHPLLVVSGKYCYFLYLFHLTVLYNVELIFDDNPVVARVASLCVCLVLAFISWRFIESPLIAIGHRWAYSVPPKDIYRACELVT
jgi:peptidoglycan/LPS O-acetylase OafA/YrhL